MDPKLKILEQLETFRQQKVQAQNQLLLLDGAIQALEGLLKELESKKEESNVSNI
jgi:hypothetical protein